MNERETKVEVTGHREERFKGMGDEGRMASGPATPPRENAGNGEKVTNCLSPI